MDRCGGFDLRKRSCLVSLSLCTVVFVAMMVQSFLVRLDVDQDLLRVEVGGSKQMGRRRHWCYLVGIGRRRPTPPHLTSRATRYQPHSRRSHQPEPPSHPHPPMQHHLRLHPPPLSLPSHQCLNSVPSFSAYASRSHPVHPTLVQRPNVAHLDFQVVPTRSRRGKVPGKTSYREGRPRLGLKMERGSVTLAKGV